MKTGTCEIHGDWVRRCEPCYSKDYRQRHPGKGAASSRKHHRKKNPLKTCKLCDKLVVNNRFDYCPDHDSSKNKWMLEQRRRDNSPVVTKQCAKRGPGCLSTFEDKKAGYKKCCPVCSKRREGIKISRPKKAPPKLGGTPDKSPDAIKQAARQVAKVGTIRRWKDEEPGSLIDPEKNKTRERVRPAYATKGK